MGADGTHDRRDPARHRGRLVHGRDRRRRLRYQRALEKGDKKVVGVNSHRLGRRARPLEILRVSHEVEIEQKCRARRAPHGAGTTTAAPRPLWPRMVEVARTDENMVPAMLEAVRAEATLGEICDALRAEWGVYPEPARF